MELTDRDAKKKKKEDSTETWSCVQKKRPAKTLKWTPNFNRTVCEVTAKEGQKAIVQVPSCKKY